MMIPLPASQLCRTPVPDHGGGHQMRCVGRSPLCRQHAELGGNECSLHVSTTIRCEYKERDLI